MSKEKREEFKKLVDDFNSKAPTWVIINGDEEELKNHLLDLEDIMGIKPDEWIGGVKFQGPGIYAFYDNKTWEKTKYKFLGDAFRDWNKQCEEIVQKFNQKEEANNG